AAGTSGAAIPFRTRSRRARHDGSVARPRRHLARVDRPSGYPVADPGRLAQLGEHQLDKLGVTGSSPVPPIESRCKSAHVVAVIGDACRVVARMSLATAFARVERAGSPRSELCRLVSEERLENEGETPR